MNREYYYKYRTKLNILHSMGGNSIHNHTLDIEILIRDHQKVFASFNDNEKTIENYFKQFEGRYINDLENFRGTQATIEDMGEVFFQELKQELDNPDFQMESISVGETPSRKYLVSDFLITGKINEFSNDYEKNLNEYIETYKEAVLKKYREKQEQKRQEEERIVKEKLSQQNVHKEPQYIDKEYSSEHHRAVYDLDQYGYIKKIGVNKLEIFLYLLATILLSAGIFFVLQRTELFRNTEEVYIHLGKARYLLSQLKQGIISPIYMKSWYDGYMMFMHSEPLTYYLLALMGFLFGSNMIAGYVATLSIVFCVTVCGFTFLGRVYDKAQIGFLSGILWFTMPEISRHYLITGDIKVLVALSFLPFCFAYIAKYFQNRGRFMALKIIVSMWLMVLADLSIAIVAFIGIFIIFTVKVFYIKEDKKLIMTAGCMLMALGLSAGWLYSAYKNGSIPEFYTNNNGYYVGITAFIILAACLFFAYKQIRMYALIGILAGVFALYRLPVAVIIMYLSVAFILLEWKKCNRKVLIALIVILGFSNVYRMQAVLHTRDTSLFEENERIKGAVIQAESVTNDNLLYLDIDKEATYPGYYMVSHGKDIIFSNKSSMKYNVITDNIQMLKYAVYTKRFDYIFDRSIEMGCDSILFNLKGLIISQQDRQKLDQASEKYGFKLMDGSLKQKYLIYHKDINRDMGNITEYKGLAIGKSSRNVSLIYPYFENGESNNLDDYSVEELSHYKKIYLSGFTYKKLKDAEKKVLQLEQQGIDIYIDMDSVPADPLTNRQKFLGVTAQTISFKNNFPEFTYKDRKIVPIKFYKDYHEWNTVYVENMDQVDGYCVMAGRILPYAGTKLDHIHFMGLNILYHVIEANDVTIQFILDDFFQLEEGTGPRRKLRNVDISYEFDRVVVKSNEDHMIVPISYQKVFQGSKKIKNVNNMLMVQKGTTVLTFDYNNFKIGVGISIFMMLLMLISVGLYRHRISGNKK